MIPIVKNRGKLTLCKTRFPGDSIYYNFCKRCQQCELWKQRKRKASRKKEGDDGK